MCESIKELSAAMAKAFAEITGAEKDKKNNHLNYQYASLSSIIVAIKPAITKYGLWFYQIIHSVAGCAAVETVIVHSSGEKLSCGIVSVPVSKNDAQGYGSGLTYAKKYSLSSAFGVSPDEDDDGEEACKPPKKPVEEVKKQAPKPKAPVESALTKDHLINQLVDVCNCSEPEFMEILARKEKYCADEGVSYCDELRRCIANPEDTIAKYTRSKAQKAFKNPIVKIDGTEAQRATA